jgi:hypothetical protein
VKLPGSHAMVDMVKEQCSQEPNIVAGVVVKIIEHCNMLMINYNSTKIFMGISFTFEILL